jgi:hypothetical protein
VVVGDDHPHLAAGQGTLSSAAVTAESITGMPVASGSDALTRPPPGPGPAWHDPPSSAARSRIETSPTPGGQPAAKASTGNAVVEDLKEQVATDQRETDLDPTGTGVPGGVGHRLGDDPVGGDLDRRWQRWQGRPSQGRRQAPSRP